MTSSPSKSQIFILHGNDEFQIDQKARAFLKERCPNAEVDGCLTTLRGDVDTIDQALEVIKQTLMAVQSLNMFSPINVTWLREVQFLSGTVFKSDDVKGLVEKLQETLGKGLGPEQILLITINGKLDARSRFLKALKAVAGIHEFTRTTKDWEIKEDAMQKLDAEFKQRNMTAEGNVLQEIAARIGNDPRLMQNEVEKLDLFVGSERSVSIADVELMVPMQQEAQVYMLGDCVGNRDLNKAMHMLQQMETNGLSSVGVIATLHNSLREMAYLGACIHAGDARVDDRGRFGKLTFLNPEAEEGFQRLVGNKTRSPFRQFQLGRQAKNFSPRELDHMLRFSAETYDAFFRSGTPQFEQLRILMVRIFYECMRKAS